MTKEWDRSKQNYFVLRRGNPWAVHYVREREEPTYVCDFPAYHYDEKLMERICFAQSDDEVREIVAGI